MTRGTSRGAGSEDPPSPKTCRVGAPKTSSAATSGDWRTEILGASTPSGESPCDLCANLPVALFLLILRIEDRLRLGQYRHRLRFRLGFGLVGHDHEAPRLVRLGGRREGRERIASDGRGDELAGEIERLAGLRRHYFARDERSE